MGKSTDDLEAVRVLVDTLEPFDPMDRERIVRWAREKLGMSTVSASIRAGVSSRGTDQVESAQSTPAVSDIKTFINQKEPRSDNHLAAVVAYYHQFQAPSSELKEAITKEDLIDACRRADRKRPARPAQVLVNSYHAGLFDKADRAHYRLNSVGENLVAMVLPEGDSQSGSKSKRRRTTSKKTSRKKAPKKKAARKKPTRPKRS